MKKNYVIAFIVSIIIIVFIIIGGIICLKDRNISNNINQEEEKLQDNGSGYFIKFSNGTNLKEKGDTVTFYKDTEKISEYTCNSNECYLGNIFEGDLAKNKHVLIASCDNCDYIETYGGISFQKDTTGKIELYNIETSDTIIFENVKNTTSTIDLELITKDDNSKYLLSFDGKINRQIKDELEMTCYEGCRIAANTINYESNLLITKENGKYGIEKLDSGEIIIPREYDNIKLTSNNLDNLYYSNEYFIGTIDGKKNLYSIKDNKQITKNGYDKIFMLSENTLFVYQEKYFSFIDLDEKQLNNDKIKVDNLYGILPKSPHGVNFSKNGENELTIILYDGTSSQDIITSEYIYNLESHELKKET